MHGILSLAFLASAVLAQPAIHKRQTEPQLTTNIEGFVEGNCEGDRATGQVPTSDSESCQNIGSDAQSILVTWSVSDSFIAVFEGNDCNPTALQGDPTPRQNGDERDVTSKCVQVPRGASIRLGQGTVPNAGNITFPAI